MLQTEYRFGEVYNLASQIAPAADKVQSHAIFSNTHGGVSLLGFTAGQTLSPHVAPADVMVYVLEGEVEFTVLDKVSTLRAGDFLLLGENVLHSVKAVADSKVMLAKAKP